MENALVVTVRVTLALALVMPLVALGGWRPDAIYPHVVGKALYFRFFTEVAFAVWLYLVLRYPAYRLPRTWLLATILAYLAVALLSSFAGVSLTRSLWSNYERMGGWIGLAHYTAFALMAASVLRTFRHWETLLNVNLLVGLVLGLLGLFEIASGRGARLGLTFGNPSFMASFVLVNAFIAAALLARSLARTPRPDPDDAAVIRLSLMRSLWVAVIVLDLLLLSQSGTRGATVGLASGTLFVLAAGAIWGERRRLRAACAVLAIGALLLGAGLLALRTSPLVTAAASLSPTISRLAAVTPEISAVQSRLAAVRYGLDGFAERPILGWGPENFYAAYDAHVDGEASARLYRFDRAHNRIVEELVTTGVLGILAFGALWCCLGWALVSRIRRMTFADRVFTALIMAAFGGYFVQNLFLFDTPGNSVQLYLLMGFVLFLGGRPISSELEEQSVQTEGRLRAFVPRSAPAQVTTVCLIVLALTAISYTLVVRPYLGATRTHAALSGSRTGDERFALYESAVSSAPWFANETVLRFAGALTEHWDRMSHEERRYALDIVERDVAAGIGREPRDWRLHLAAAELYNRAAPEDRTLLARSRLHTERVTEIAPGRVEAMQLRAQQLITEGRHDDALALIDGYLERSEPYLPTDSATYRSLERIRGVALAGP